jgi:hypothetical protein
MKDCLSSDNAVAESFFASLTKDLLRRRSLRSRAEGADRRLRLHRDLLQLDQAPLHARLPSPVDYEKMMEEEPPAA